MENTFVIHWRIWSNLQSLTVRRGYTVIVAPNKRDARTKLRRNLRDDIHRGEKLVIDNIVASGA